MKRIISVLLIAAAALQSCNFLDVDPELGVTEEEVFGIYKNHRNFLYAAYDADDQQNILHMGSPMVIDMCRTRYPLICTTDAADAGRYGGSHNQWKDGYLKQQLLGRYTFDTNWGGMTSGSNEMPIVSSMFKVIRIANMSLEHMDELVNVEESQKNDLIGHAYFIRGYAHFVLVRYFGGMPYVDHVLQGSDNWDMARLTSFETLTKAADDLQLAYEYMKAAGYMRRDPAPGQPGHLESADQDKPGACAAIALKARVLLYAASPLNNTTGDSEIWKKAAEAAALAVEECEAAQYELKDFSQYEYLFRGYQYNSEEIWGRSMGSAKSSSWLGYFSKAQADVSATTASGMCPTQNFVDRYETQWGDPLYTDEDRAAAQALGHFNPQDPYAALDPRFYKTIVYDGASTDHCKCINIYYDTAAQQFPTSTFAMSKGDFTSVMGTNPYDNPMDTKSRPSFTGYYINKFWDGQLGGSNGSKYYMMDNIIRMAEVYLNYAEAVNEAYGPSGKAGTCAYTALEAVNKVRARAGMPEVQSQFTGSTEAFRDRVRNERCVELAYESQHYFFDIRRWKIAPQTMGATLYGMYITTCTKDADHPNGKLYTRQALPTERQCELWRDYMYVIPWPASECKKMANFVNNQEWR